MSDSSDLDYYRQREQTCREQSTAARDPAVAAVHGELADRYAAIVRVGAGAGLPDRGRSVEPPPLGT